MDGLMESAFGPIEKTAALTRMIARPSGRRALRYALPAATGAYAGSRTLKDEPGAGAAAGVVGGLIAGLALRRMLGNNPMKALRKAQAKIKSPTQKARLSRAFGRVHVGKPVSDSDARLVLKHLRKQLGSQALEYGAAGAIGGIAAPKLRHWIAQLQLPQPVIITKTSAPRKEHWRKLEPGQTGSGPQGKSTPGKTWVDFDDGDAFEKEPGYLKRVAKVSPLVAVKGLADVPEGAVEKKIEGRLLRKRVPLRKAVGFGGRRYAGGVAAGALTFPAFAKGVEMLGSKDPKERAKGHAIVLASMVPYQGAKGAMESLKGAKGKRVLEALKGGGARAMVNVPAAIGTGLGIAKAKKKDDKERGPLRTALYGAAGGAAGGALKGGAEVPVSKYLLKKKEFEGVKGIRQVARRAGARAAGRGAAGAMGGAVLGALFGVMAKSMKG
jgi:hypothetical protein